jgi:hypothetical protein
MLRSEEFFTGGIGKLVFGGLEITGVGLESSVLLHAVNSNRLQRTTAKRTCWLSSLLLKDSNLFVELIIDRVTFILFLGKRLTGHAILTFNPAAEIDELAPFRTEGTKRIIFPVGRLTAGWTFHQY